MQGIWTEEWLQPASTGPRHDAGGAGTIWQNGPRAQAIFNRIINHRLQLLVRQGMPFSFAKRTASSELWGPLSCTLLRAAWQAHAECAPRVGMADIYDALESLPNSPAETQLSA